MKHHLNTLFVTTQGAYLSKEGEAVVVRVEKETRLRVPLHTLGGIVCFGNVACSSFLMGLCGERGVAISFLTEQGKFLARVHGFTSGNVLLRREQYRRADDPAGAADVARAVLLAKIANSRVVLLRAARDHAERSDPGALQRAAVHLDRCLGQAQAAPGLDTLRGVEGDAARAYFGAFDHLVTAQKAEFAFRERSRRPPLDNLNALLSFLYALLAHDARSACEAAGLAGCCRTCKRACSPALCAGTWTAIRRSCGSSRPISRPRLTGSIRVTRTEGSGLRLGQYGADDYVERSQ